MVGVLISSKERLYIDSVLLSENLGRSQALKPKYKNNSLM